ncbi:MAG: protein translocase subunit SecD [Alphaproteobacteria bacterium]|nr:protein translocase subunit SecD [Alphaproteobacteria bacterium]
MFYFAPWRIVLTSLICLAGVIFSIPNLFSRAQLDSLPDWLPTQQINFGLDLRGGSHLMLEVDMETVIKERLESQVDAVRGALRAKQIGYTNLGVEAGMVRVDIRDAAKREEALREIRALAAPVSGAGMFVGAVRDIDVTAEAGGRIQVALTAEALAERKRHAIAQSIEIIRRRIDEAGTRDPTIQRQGEDRILVQLPGEQNPDRVKRLIGKTAKMVFRLVDPTATPEDIASGRAPAGSEILESDGRRADGSAEQHYAVRKRIMVAGDTLVDAQPTFQQGMPVVSFRFDSAGARRFGDATKENVGKPFAIVLDDRVISAPVIREPILGGSGIISGSFTVESARDLAVLLRAGALPAPLRVIEERTVGPSLGSDSIAAGRFAGAIALVLVVGYMIATYRLFGVLATLALGINMALIIGALSLLQMTLTLPGIAGIVLTIGMAVDASVLIFERIREETRAGKTPIAAMDAGFARAFATIFDSNITTFFAAAILFAMGSGPVRGFAVTLGLGLITSVYTAVEVTRLIMVFWYRRTRPRLLPV